MTDPWDGTDRRGDASSRLAVLEAQSAILQLLPDKITDVRLGMKGIETTLAVIQEQILSMDRAYTASRLTLTAVIDEAVKLNAKMDERLEIVEEWKTETGDVVKRVKVIEDWKVMIKGQALGARWGFALGVGLLSGGLGGVVSKLL